MKLFIINGENNDEKIEININEYLMVRDIKNKLDEIYHGNGNFTKDYFTLIYKNIILFNNFLIKSYKICENDEIWLGKIENYLRKDDVILYVFYYEKNFGGEYLIVKENYTISTVRSIIKVNHSEIINIWNADGNEMKNYQIVTEIDTNKNYKLIIRCDDGRGNEINNTFEECCYLHDRTYLDDYLFVDQIRDNNKDEPTRILLINRMIKIRQILLLNDTIDDRLNQNLSELPSSFLNSTNLFCIDISHRIVDICKLYWIFVMNQYEYDVVKIFDQYFPFAILAALWNYSNVQQLNKNKANKSLNSILIDALDYFVKYLIDFNNDWKYWLRLWMNQYLLKPFSDSFVNMRISQSSTNKFYLKTRINGKNSDFFIPFNLNSVIDAKEAISKAFNVDLKHLYCIMPGGDHKPNDKDAFDDKFIIEIVLNMDDIEILKSLGRGGFGEVYLCLDKISQQQFVMKRGISKDDQLCRDINIYSKLDSSKFIMNYSGLFRDDEGIAIAMQYMTGGTLCGYLKSVKHITEYEIIRISSQILVQITELHENGIIHRDIKSDNIVLDDQRNAKLIDFGLSKYSDGLTNKEMLEKLKVYLPGTIYYMAPELIKLQPYSNKIDIWSFGMVMVEMVTGKRPFPGLNDYRVTNELLKYEQYKFKSIMPISNELEQFINSCLKKNPNERPSAKQLVDSEFFKYWIYLLNK